MYIRGLAQHPDKEFVRFLRIALGSINEVVTCLYIAKDLGYLREPDFKNLYEYSHKLSAMINALIGKLKWIKKLAVVGQR